MYNFAIVAMLGLATWKFVGFLLGLYGKDLSSAVRSFVTLAVGVIAAVALDYDAFTVWGANFREDWMGPLVTGLVIGSMAYVWHHVLGAIEAYGRHHRDEARSLETRTPRAA